jgi:hypothetical protein
MGVLMALRPSLEMNRDRRVILFPTKLAISPKVIILHGEATEPGKRRTVGSVRIQTK